LLFLIVVGFFIDPSDFPSWGIRINQIIFHAPDWTCCVLKSASSLVLLKFRRTEEELTVLHFPQVYPWCFSLKWPVKCWREKKFLLQILELKISGWCPEAQWWSVSVLAAQSVRRPKPSVARVLIISPAGPSAAEQAWLGNSQSHSEAAGHLCTWARSANTQLYFQSARRWEPGRGSVVERGYVSGFQTLWLKFRLRCHA